MDIAGAPYIRIALEEGDPEEIEIPPFIYLALAQAAILLLPDDGAQYMNMVSGLMLFPAALLDSRVDIDEATNLNIAALTYFMETAKEHGWKTPTDAMLHLSYLMLVQRLTTRQEVFEIASKLANTNPPKSANSWRVRVDAYVKERGLAPIGQPIRKPRTDYV